jgi:uncharacterized linocin/CFP29 family protein
MLKLIGGDDLLARGVEIAQLRPVFTQNMEQKLAEGYAVNATLRKDEWEAIDARVNDVLRQRLTIVDDLRSYGLVMPLSLGDILRVTERLNDMDAADVSYDGDTAPQRDRPDFGRDVIPVPVLSKDFQLNWRQLEASRKKSMALDTTSAGMAARKVRDKLQYVIVNGYGAGPGANPANGTDGQSIPGLINAANRLTQAKSASWGLAATDIIGDTQKMLKKAYDNYLFGPFVLYVPKNSWAILQMDYSTAKGEKTFLERILAFSDIKSVRPLDDLPDDNVILIQMTEDVIDLSEAQAITTVQWDKNPFVTNFRVLTVAGPQIKSVVNQAGTTLNGFVHLS